MVMGAVQAPDIPELVDVPYPETVCRCGHCRAVIDVARRQRRVRCRNCGWLNTVPTRLHVVCERCSHNQQVRFQHLDCEPLCANCGHALWIREIELAAVRRRLRRGRRRRGRRSGRDSVLLTILVYALLLWFFLLWFMWY
jgi:hypothetical protein